MDPRKQIIERNYQEEGKGGTDMRYVTKRGFYMDYHIKVVKGLPAPSAYNLKDSFDQTMNRKKNEAKKIDTNLSKYTYLDRIEI